MHIKEFIERMKAGKIPDITVSKPLYVVNDVVDPNLCDHITCNLRDVCRLNEVKCSKSK